jgi:hypothetical protein
MRVKTSRSDLLPFAVTDRRLAAIVRRMRDLPGYDLDGSLAQAMTGRSLDACVKRLLGRRPQARSLGPLLKKSLHRLRRCGTQLAGTAAHPPPSRRMP